MNLANIIDSTLLGGIVGGIVSLAVVLVNNYYARPQRAADIKKIEADIDVQYQEMLRKQNEMLDAREEKHRQYVRDTEEKISAIDAHYRTALEAQEAKHKKYVEETEEKLRVFEVELAQAKADYLVMLHQANKIIKELLNDYNDMRRELKRSLRAPIVLELRSDA